MHRWWIGLALSTWTLATAHAEPSAITFEQALGLADGLPEIVAARDLATKERAIELPRAWQPLSVIVTPQARLAPSDARGLEGGIAVQQYVPFDDPTPARRDVLERQAEARLARATAMQLDARLAIASAWITAWAATERRAAAEHEYELARAIVDVTTRGLAAGVFTSPELADAKAFLAEVDVRRSDAEGEVSETSFALAEAMAATTTVRVAGALPSAPLPPATVATELLARAQRLPAIAAVRLSARVDRARAVEERAARGPQVIVGAEVFRDEPGAFVAGLSIGFSMPHDRGQREAREAELAARTSDAEASQLGARAAIQLARGLHEVTHTQEVLEKLRDLLVPATEDAAARRQRALAIGETTIVELLAARRAALLARSRLADARAAHAWARIAAYLLVEATAS